jgi:hypothetical protein
MKFIARCALIALVALCWSESCFAQRYPPRRQPYPPAYPPPWAYFRPEHGLRVGWSFSQLRSDNGDKFLPNVVSEYYFGYLTDRHLFPGLNFGAGLEIHKIGSRDRDFEEINLLYLSIPLNLRIDVGPYFARIGASGSVRFHAQEYLNGQLVSTRNNYRRWDSGYFIGGGVRMLIFFAEIRHIWGQMNIIDNYQSRQWQLGGGLLF